ncbi:hypothetical protein [Leptolyngbya ohadii]|uniref:hypothetical protein n=1 Tax=Leptolyngbya ohadii TaxID=1962290 RepID=UPI000B59FF67|nr:hypothetical protein [Leptolyngbya ohadii]
MILSQPSGLKKCIASIGLSLISIGTISVGTAILFRATPAQAADPATAIEESESAQRLMQMFSPEIQKTLNVCREQGQVNLTADEGANGAVVCGDGTVQAEIPLQTYLNTASDFLAASALLGLRQQMETTPQLTPEQLYAILSTTEGKAVIQDAVVAALVQSGAIEANSDGAALLSNQVMDKLLPTMEQTNNLRTLLGTEAQYKQIVQSFCTAPGMPIEQAQQQTTLSPVQLYAICIQESGLLNETTGTSR